MAARKTSHQLSRFPAVLTKTLNDKMPKVQFIELYKATESDKQFDDICL